MENRPDRLLKCLDLDQLDLFRYLPLSPMADAAAQGFAPSLVLSIVDLLLLTSVAFGGYFPNVDSHHSRGLGRAGK